MDEVLVFGRTDYAEPLTERGTDALEDAGAGTWVELVTFPQSAAHWIIREGEDAEHELTARAGR
jgi:hypothetical protein